MYISSKCTLCLCYVYITGALTLLTLHVNSVYVRMYVRMYVCMYFMYVVRLKSEEVSRDDPVWEEAIGAPFSC